MSEISRAVEYSRIIIHNTVIRAFPPNRRQKFVLRFMIWLGVGALTGFSIWFFKFSNVGYLPLYLPLTGALIFKLFRMLHEWYHYYDIDVPEPPKMFPAHTVDMFTTACPGEPYDMIVNTLKAMVAVRYPHKSYLCDEGNDPYLKEICNELGVYHVTRTIKIDAKAGNINNALKQSDGDLCVVLDPDHVPHPDFLDRVLPYFADKEVGYVQCVQGYGNQKESFIAQGAAEQTYHFYGPMMMCMHKYGTVQAIGANCTFRRKALESIGGHAAGLSEDMHTAMRIHSEGWKTIYIPEILSKGLVPTSLSAYYKQQLKWSRGTFDLLFHVYPKLFKKFTWRQKLHYLTLPMYFSIGFISLIDILVPIIALITFQIPWQVEFGHFAMIFSGLLGISLLIRMYAQNWVLEKHERGLHLVGGLLRHSTWWIFLLGFFYTVFNVKVPYIPTQKDNEPQNSWLLATPNIVLCLISIVAIIYGLSMDWNPYSFFMASFAAVNTLLLGISVLIGQEKFLLKSKIILKKIFNLDWLLLPLRETFWQSKQFVYYLIRKSSIAFSCFFAFVFVVGFFELKNTETLHTLDIEEGEKDYGAFYIGSYLNNKELSRLINENKNKKSFDLTSFDLSWDNSTGFPDKEINAIHQRNGIPLINWYPETRNFNKFSDAPYLSQNLGVLEAISKGELDFYLSNFAQKARETRLPIILNFAPEPDNPKNSWSSRGGNTPEDYIAAWQYIVTWFIDNGVYNVTWVWSPWKPSGVNQYSPGEHYIDWVGVSILNEADNESANFLHTFEVLYDPFHRQLEKSKNLNKKPVMITQLGALPNNHAQSSWIKESFETIKENYPNIKSLIFFQDAKESINYAESDFESYSSVKSKIFSFNKEVINIIPEILNEAPFNKRLTVSFEEISKNTSSKVDRNYIQGSPGNYQLLVDKKPYYIQGVAYNPAHDWRDGNWPLTRNTLLKDLGNVKAAGANTIRRYSPGYYDKNILTIANELDLKVLYGFWFDPEKNYITDNEIIEKYKNQIVEKIDAFKEYNSVLGWSIGNETWGLLKHHYGEPYLTIMRLSYMNMVDNFAAMIHQIDSSRPVITACEHSWKLSTELAAWSDNSPTIDIIAINSYYESQISKLGSLTWKFNPDRPYIVSEFGPRGYWNPELSSYQNDSLLLEESDNEKVWRYSREWKKYVASRKGQNVGGFAYCWRDRMEGSNTWFGLTDYKGRLKPTYHALKSIWTNTNYDCDLYNSSILKIDYDSINSRTKFEVQIGVHKNSNLHYEWYLNREEYMERVGNIDELDNGKKVWVKIPKEYSKYRLYVYASDELGNVTTASIPLRNNPN